MFQTSFIRAVKAVLPNDEDIFTIFCNVVFLLAIVTEVVVDAGLVSYIWKEKFLGGRGVRNASEDT